MRSATRFSLIMSASVGPFDVFGVAALRQAVRRQIRFAAELDDAFGDLVGVALFLVRVCEKLLGDRLRVDAARHEVVTPIAQHANDLGGQRIVEQSSTRRRGRRCSLR